MRDTTTSAEQKDVWSCAMFCFLGVLVQFSFLAVASPSSWGLRLSMFGGLFVNALRASAPSLNTPQSIDRPSYLMLVSIARARSSCRSKAEVTELHPPLFIFILCRLSDLSPCWACNRTNDRQLRELLPRRQSGIIMMNESEQRGSEARLSCRMLRSMKI